MDGASINRNAWNAQAHALLPNDHAQNAPGRFEWTQYPGHGPGIELFGQLHGQHVVELGCGNGDNLAAVAMTAARCTGVDVAPGQIRRARIRWGHLGIRYACDDAGTYLTLHRAPLDICYSVFGAIGHTPPAQILPLIAARLRPGGHLLFSVADPDWLGQNRRALQLPSGGTVPVARWLASPTGWRQATRAAGFVVTDTHEVDAPAGSARCCFVISATKPKQRSAAR
ncbi:class I SAM-dependent methyltransferase [Micromonospora sp. CA-263727]|uniref:class I SAM-dependent methyltransferase n=1 Tax=Micromonospora sp. CA-263727 TaxID=3239967 RepID=UPI003D8EE93C